MKPTLSQFLIFSVIALSASAAWADDAATLFSAARAHNPEIQAALAEWKAAQARIPQARSLPNPTASLESMGYGAEGSENTALFTQAFPWPGTLGLRENAASLQARSTWHEVEAIELSLASQIRKLVYDIAFLKKESEIFRSTLDLYQKQEAFLEEVNRGGGDITDLLRIEIEAGLLGDDLALRGEEIIRRSAELEAIVGRPISAKELAALRLPSTPPREASMELTSQLKLRNPILQALATRVEAARVGISLARVETMPDFMVGAGYRRVVEPGMGNSTEAMSEGVLMFSIGLPIFGAKNRGIRDEASAMLEVAEAEYETRYRMLSAQVAIFSSRQRDAARRTALFQKTLLSKARQNHESFEAAYRAGSANLVSLLEGRRALLETETGYWRALTDQHIHRADLDSLFGTQIKVQNPATRTLFKP